MVSITEDAISFLISKIKERLTESEVQALIDAAGSGTGATEIYIGSDTPPDDAKIQIDWTQEGETGGGSSADWEFINEATLDGDAYGIYIDKDADGNDFSLKAILVVVRAYPPENEVNNTGVKLSVAQRITSASGAWSFPCCGMPTSSYGSTDPTTLTMYHGIVIAGQLYPVIQMRGYNTAMYNAMGQNYTGAQTSNYISDNIGSDDGLIHKVGIGSYVAVCGAGTYMKVYGIRG